ncbi:hypothetical protein VO56_02235 [Mycoplasmopsis gallinacea]|uniref:Uncharacterized protein n=1 Tax=Mycoplasmopsis gallinacea TaxID=29556 RepID=A0A0D5ZK00_9BACT|nr:hypothetical protein VO56_02235 [Mycoplasmopsis gallinacea]
MNWTNANLELIYQFISNKEDYKLEDIVKDFNKWTENKTTDQSITFKNYLIAIFENFEKWRNKLYKELIEDFLFSLNITDINKNTIRELLHLNLREELQTNDVVKILTDTLGSPLNDIDYYANRQDKIYNYLKTNLNWMNCFGKVLLNKIFKTKNDVELEKLLKLSQALLENDTKWIFENFENEFDKVPFYEYIYEDFISLDVAYEHYRNLPEEKENITTGVLLAKSQIHFRKIKENDAFLQVDNNEINYFKTYPNDDFKLIFYSKSYLVFMWVNDLFFEETNDLILEKGEEND